MNIRNVEITDGKKLWNMLNELDKETKHMPYEPGERKWNEESYNKNIQDAIDGIDLMMVCEYENEIVGFIGAKRAILNRTKHTATVAIGLKEAHRGKGYGTKLFELLDKWAIEKEIIRLELWVTSNNIEGISLYKKFGFVTEGTKKKAEIVDGKFVPFASNPICIYVSLYQGNCTFFTSFFSLFLYSFLLCPLKDV